MSRSEDFSSGAPGAHVTEELPTLIAGELDLDATRDVTNHLRACAECRQELVEVTAGIGLMRRLDGVSEAADVTPVRRTAIGESTRRTRPRTTLLVAAALIVVLLGVVTSVVALTNGDRAPRAKVALTPVSQGTADGTVAMQESGSAQAMEVDTSLGAAPSDQYYEVWLLDRDTGKMLPVGVLPPDGRGTFRLPSELLAGYDTVDISLQPNNGGTSHSDESVLRADYS